MKLAAQWALTTDKVCNGFCLREIYLVVEIHAAKFARICLRLQTTSSQSGPNDWTAMSLRFHDIFPVKSGLGKARSESGATGVVVKEHRRAWRGSCIPVIDVAIVRALSPDSRIIPNPPLPEAVAMATIVS
jgi:hypothetical protein